MADDEDKTKPNVRPPQPKPRRPVRNVPTPNNASRPSAPSSTPETPTPTIAAHETHQNHQQVPPSSVAMEISLGDAFFVRAPARTTQISHDKVRENYLTFFSDNQNAPASGSNGDKSSNDTTADKPTTLDASDNAGVINVDSGDEDASDGSLSQSSFDSSDSENRRQRKRRKKCPSIREPQLAVQPIRSPSLTPPPALPETKMIHFRAEMARQLTSFTDFGPETTSVAFSVPSITPLNPQLESLAERYKRKELSNEPLPEAGANNVTVKVQGISDPRIDYTKEPLKTIKVEFQKPMQFRVRSNQNFAEMYSRFSKQKNIPPQELVFTYQDVKVFSSSTPANLNMTGTVTIEAFTNSTFAYMVSYKEEERKRKLAEMAQQNEALAQQATSDSQVEYDNDAPVDSAGAMKLCLQCKDRSVVRLIAKPTTLVASIIQTLRRKRADISPDAKIQLEFEGESLDPEIRLEDTEIEDGDMLSVFVG